MTRAGGCNAPRPAIDIDKLRGDKHVHPREFLEEQPINPAEQRRGLIHPFGNGSEQTAEDRGENRRRVRRKARSYA